MKIKNAPTAPPGLFSKRDRRNYWSTLALCFLFWHLGWVSGIEVHAPTLAEASTIEGTITKVTTGRRGGGVIVVDTADQQLIIHSYATDLIRRIGSHTGKYAKIYFYTDRPYFSDRYELADLEIQGNLIRGDWDKVRNAVNDKRIPMVFATLGACLFIFSLWKIYAYSGSGES